MLSETCIILTQSRRAFHALKGIIRLQALVRGHLVRRQAVVTLRSLQGVVRLQALIRGRRVRLSGIGLEVNTKCNQGKDVVNFFTLEVGTFKL